MCIRDRTLLALALGTLFLDASAQELTGADLKEIASSFVKDGPTTALQNALTAEANLRKLALNRDLQGKMCIRDRSIAEQAAQVRRVKRAENGMIYDPVTISKENTVGDALNLMKENRIGGIPVVDGARKLIGIVTNRDLRFQRDMSRKIAEVMTPGDRLITTHNSALEHASEVLLNNKIEKLPVVDDEGRLVGLITYKDITKVQDLSLIHI